MDSSVLDLISVSILVPRKVLPSVSQCPSHVAIAATWDKDSMYERGRAIRQEFFELPSSFVLPDLPIDD
ncbi:hypothetical protein BT69DRAFT_357994 [Atractiella rhizophila]|nr:hypothetical protein BT69DRAFT_357994 [Atractiella rhizophila]